MPKITKRLIDSLVVKPKRYIVWDTELRGFGIAVTPYGTKAYVLKYRNKFGRQRKPVIGRHGAITPDEARNIATHWLSEIIKGNDPSEDKTFDRHSMTVMMLADRFIKEYSEKRNKAQTTHAYKELVRNKIKPALGQLKVSAVVRADIVRLHQKISLKTPYAANRTLALLSKMFNWAEAMGVRDDNTNPCRHVQKNPESKKERFLSNTELSKLGKVLAEAERTQMESIYAINAIKLLLYTGCRLREILNLKWEYVCTEENCFKLPDSKTGAKRVYYSPIVADLLKTIIRQPENPYVIVGRIEGKQLNNLEKPWRRIREAAGLKDVRMHDLRHSFASVAAASGLSLPIIGALLGHSQTQTTARYTHLLGEPMKEAASIINNSMKEAMKYAQ